MSASAGMMLEDFCKRVIRKEKFSRRLKGTCPKQLIKFQWDYEAIVWNNLLATSGLGKITPCRGKVEHNRWTEITLEWELLSTDGQ